MLQIELVYVKDDKSLIQIHLDLPEGSSVSQALELAKLYEKYPEIRNFSLGIFSRPVDGKTLLKQGDRLEIYRPLKLNPMEKRRQRAKKTKNR